MKKTPKQNEAPRHLGRTAEESGGEILSYEYPENDDTFEEELEREFGHDPKLKASRSQVIALRAFRNACPSIKNIDPEYLSVYVIHPKTARTNDRLNVAPARAFGVNPDNIFYTIHGGTEASAATWQRNAGVDIKKGSAEQRRLSKPADIVIVMDADVRPTNKLLASIKPGHWILWPLKTANTLRAKGYKFRGVVEHGGTFPHVDKEIRGFWKDLEIKGDEDLRNASKLGGEEGVVTYEDAKKAVREVYGDEKNIVERYKELIEKAGEQNPELVEKGETNLTYTFERKGDVIEISINTVLPLKEREYDEKDFAIFKKKDI